MRLFIPDATGPWPLVLFSHGLGASREYYGYLGRYWASHGYLSVHPTHPGTDTSLWRDRARPWPAMCEALDDPHQRITRPRDLRFVLDRLAEDAEFGARVDWRRVAAAGHSYGAFGAMMLAGMRADLPGDADGVLADSRIRAVIAMSPQGVGMFGLNEHSWDQIATPILFLTGTNDRGLRTKTVACRREAYDRITGPDQYHAVIRRANHFAFSDGDGIGLSPPPRDPDHHGYIQWLTTAFLSAHLRADADAQAWLLGDGVAAATNGACRVESKNVRRLDA